MVSKEQLIFYCHTRSWQQNTKRHMVHGATEKGVIIKSTIINSNVTALGPTQPRIQWVPGALSLGVKRPGRKADHSSPSIAEVKE
jgi:hypothetical protein